MTDATDKARGELDKAVAHTPTDTHVLLRVAYICRAALDYHDARDGPQWVCPDCGYVSPSHWEAKLHANEADHLPAPDAHAEASQEFKEAVK